VETVDGHLKSTSSLVEVQQRPRPVPKDTVTNYFHTFEPVTEEEGNAELEKEEAKKLGFWGIKGPCPKPVDAEFRDLAPAKAPATGTRPVDKAIVKYSGPTKNQVGVIPVDQNTQSESLGEEKIPDTSLKIKGVTPAPDGPIKGASPRKGEPPSH
jgi:hypothetical protein